MSEADNKTSDKNVANIEKDIKNIKQYINLVLDKSYCDCNELNVISTGKHCDGSKNVAYSMQNILAELEQKDKRIQELEEENKKKSIELICYQEELDNSIPEQAIKDKIEKLKNDYDQKYDLYMGYKVESREQQDILKQMSILQELLEGEK